MQFKEFEQGKLNFISKDAKISRRLKSNPMFLFDGEYYSSEYFAVEYFKSKGYDAFFSENTTWKNLLKTLFKDIFKKFKKLAEKKHYKKDFYDNEFYRIYEGEINERFNYLKNADLKSIIAYYSINKWVKYRIMKMCDHIEKDQILSVLYHIIQDYAHNHIGFPDLFVFNENEFFFCEVKANSDTLKPVQVRRQELLLKMGIDVSVFGINKKVSWISDEQQKYFNENYVDEENFIEFYDYKIRVANETYAKFKNEAIGDIKANFLAKYDLDTFIAFLNIISRRDNIEISEGIIKESIRESKKIKNLRYLSKGMHFEERGLYSKAIEEYNHVETFERYERLNECYRRNKDGEKQVNLIYHVLNDVEDIPSDIKKDFKMRANRLFRNKKAISTYGTDKTCPLCGSMIKLTTLRKRNNISIFTCTKSGCYWYGGVFNGDIRDFSKYDGYGTAESDFSDLEIDIANLSYDEKIKLKRRIVRKGNSYIDKGENGNAIEFYRRLLEHGLFANDYHPYRKLAKLYHKERQYENEVEIIESFFSSGIYCDELQLEWFLKKLNRLAKYDNIEHSRITELENEFMDNGANNKALSSVPVPQAIELKKSRKKF